MSYARTRFLAAVICAITGAVLGVGALTLSVGTERWLALGVGAEVLLVLAWAFATPARGAAQRVLDLPLALVGAWTIVCARVIEISGAGSSPHAVKWFNLASGAAISSFGVVSLLLHEYLMERELASEAKRAVCLEASARLALNVGSQLDRVDGDERSRGDRDKNGAAGGRHEDAVSRTAG